MSCSWSDFDLILSCSWSDFDLILSCSWSDFDLILSCSYMILSCYERDLNPSVSEDTQSEVIEAFSSTSRYLGDLLNIVNNFCDSKINQIYPSRLQLNQVSVSDTKA